MKNICFEIDGELIDLRICNLLIWRISDISFTKLVLKNNNGHKILGINYNDINLSKSVLANSFKREFESIGESTFNFLNQNLDNYDLSILYPAGFDINSIEYIIEKSQRTPLIILLNSSNYYKLFADDSYDQIKQYKSLTKNTLPIFKINKL